MYEVDRFEYCGLTVVVSQDDMAESPRQWDNLGTMVCFHPRYNLGDKHDFSGPDDFREWIEETDPQALILPLYLYDHSGITMNTGGFHCPWDSGQVGWIYITREDIRKEYGAKRVSSKLRQRVADYLKGEVATYSRYIEGNVYGYAIENDEGDTLDSCWGFVGYSDDEYLISSAKDAAEYHAKAEQTRKVRELVSSFSEARV